MAAFTESVSLVLFFFLVLLASSVAMQLLNGKINTRFLLFGAKADGTRYFSPERVQLLLFTVWAALSYLFKVLETLGSGTLPDVPEKTLYLLSGSHALYLGGKALAMFGNNQKEN